MDCLSIYSRRFLLISLGFDGNTRIVGFLGFCWTIENMAHVMVEELSAIPTSFCMTKDGFATKNSRDYEKHVIRWILG